MRSFPLGILVTASLFAAAPAQVTATYAPYGTGCNGTGTGLGGNHVLPAAMANTFGASDNTIPLGWYPVRYQQVFLGADLPAAFTAGGLALRQDNRGPVVHGFTADLEIQIGFTTRTPQTMNTTFAANFDSGAPVVVLPRAQIVFPDMPLNPTTPADFFFTIPWPVAFAWNPAAGRNVLIQVTVFGNSNGGQPWAYPLDATWGGTTRLYGSPAAATTGTLEPNYGLVLGLRELTNTAVPQLYSTSTPMIGDTFRVRLGQAHASAFGLLAIGLSDQWFGTSPLPLDLSPHGAPGCWLLAAAESTQLVLTNSVGYGSLTYSLPNNIYLLRMRFYNQFLVHDPAVNGLGFVVSNAGAGLIGNQ